MLLLITVVCVLLVPDHAFAWGPAAHIDFGLQTLGAPTLLSAATAALLERYRLDFLHGTLAADIIVGKNRAAAHDHSHGWPVARRLFVLAREQGPARHAFMLGYLHHLGADIVAHNHVIPELLVVHYRVNRAGHLYFESRVDQRLLTPLTDRAWHETSAMDFRAHDEFLRRNLVSTLFSNSVSAMLYRRNLDIQRGGPWRMALQRIDRNSRILIDGGDLARWRKLAVFSAIRAMENPLSPRLDRLDPTGRDALHAATETRAHLRREHLSGNRHLPHLHREALRRIRVVSIDHFEPDEGPDSDPETPVPGPPSKK